jgi:hypothetical protein
MTERRKTLTDWKKNPTVFYSLGIFATIDSLNFTTLSTAKSKKSRALVHQGKTTRWLDDRNYAVLDRVFEFEFEFLV